MSPETPLRTWRGRTIHPANETEQTAAARVNQRLENLRDRLQGSLFFVPSPADGWGVPALLQNLPTDAAIVFLEKDPELLAWSKTRVDVLTTGHPGVFWLAEDSEEAIRELFACLPLNQLRRCEWLTVSGGWLLAAERYRQVFRRLQDGLATHWSNRMTSLHLGPLWVRNVFDHLACATVAPLEWPVWGDDPIVVCGAGTSLDLLIAHRTSIRLLAADTALPVLAQAGLVPDAVVCLEAQQANLNDFVAAAGRKIPLFLDLSSHPATRRALAGPTYWFHTPFASLELWKRLPWKTQVPRIPPLGSVGVTAAAIAWKLTQGPVYLLGLDFSWPLGKTHARGAPSITSLLIRNDRFHPVQPLGSWKREGIRAADDKGWLTSGVLEGYAHSLAELAQKEKHRTRVVGHAGLDLGLESLEDWPGVPITKTPIATPSAQAFSDGASGERKELTALLAAFEALNRAPEDPEVWETLETRLRRNNHLFFSFADPDIRQESSFLSRVLMQARWLNSRLESRSRP